MRVNKIKSVFSALLIVVITLSTCISDVNVTLAKEAKNIFISEIDNDNPDVTFTATGIATEPMPINVTPFPASEFMSWTNTSLDKSWINNGWFASADGRLISARMGNGVHSKFSLPIGAENMDLDPKEIKLPYGGAAPYHYLGQGEYVSSATFADTNYGKQYLLGDTHDPILLSPFAVNGSAPVMYVRKDLGEIMFRTIVSPRNTGGSRYQYNEYWWRYRIDDLLALRASASASGSFMIEIDSGRPSYTGARGTFSNGDELGRYARMRFNSDFKEINLTTRTIKSFKPDNMATPYKTESFDNIPAEPRYNPGNTSQNGYIAYLPDGLDEILGTSSGAKRSVDDEDIGYWAPAGDPKGNYYTLSRINNKPHLIRWDAETGFPSIVKQIVAHDKINGFIGGGVSADQKYVGISYCWPYDSEYETPAGCNYYYENLSTSAVTTTKPGDFFEWSEGTSTSDGYKDYTTYRNGYGTHRITGKTIDLLSGVEINPQPRSNQLPTSSTRYIGGSTTKAGVEYSISYGYKPSTGQSPYSNEPITFGQLFNPSSQQVLNGTISWTMKFAKLDGPDYHAGMGFRIQNHQNMYRVEVYKDNVQLVRIVNGRKALISTPVSHILNNEQQVSYKIKITGSHIKVYENNGLIIDATDGAFSSGTLGPYSTADNTEFKGISYMWSESDLSYDTPGAVIVNTPIKYETTFDDPERDAMFAPLTQWYIDHVDPGRFLTYTWAPYDADFGLSSMHGQTVTNPVPQFDKVGLYKLKYRVPDNPRPDNAAFDSYRKYSEDYEQYLIVHRIPEAPFTLHIEPDGTVGWTDLSFDPDRCYAHGNCQPDFAANNGIYAKKFYYITPSGVKKDSKLVRPLEGGEYTVAMAVRDENKAWSDWYIQTIDIDQPVAPNHPPTVWLTFPNGTYAEPSHVSLQPTLTWNQADIDPNTIFSTFNLCVRDISNNPVECVTNRDMSTPLTSWAWTMDTQLSMGQKYSVQVQVSDGEDWSDWSNIGWMSTNSPPVAYMTFPYGTQAVPNIVNTLRPELTWYQSDPDIGYILYWYQIQITNEANDIMIFDSGKVWQNTTSTTGKMTVPADLPTGQKLRVRVKVYDQYGAESNWSPQTWMMINRPPKAIFSWKVNPPVDVFEGPAWEGDHIQLYNQSTDPDGDAITSVWSVIDPSGHVTTSATEPYITFAQPGNFDVTLTVTDIHGASDSLTRRIVVSPMVLLGYVNHTDDWNSHRIQYNQSKTRTNESPRTYDVFFPGEKFVLKAVTTGNVVKTDSQIKGTVFKTNLPKLSGNAFDGIWTGELWSEEMLKWDTQTIYFLFTATTPTGYQKTVEVPVKIDDDLYWRQHRSR
ncbi:PKD domain-containing protein [Paenibacillus periandrae]|uniref:glycoside hydrolase family 78 protein n=1 Tax=Paenibacillus periandrae TaxID=1761741 RepID=UPI001F08CB51|nr:PKD domain-containing protein [Paenibacillus periandrae]